MRLATQDAPSLDSPPSALPGHLYSPHPCGSPFGQRPLQTSAILPMFPRFAGKGTQPQWNFSPRASIAMIACLRFARVSGFFAVCRR